MCNAKMNSILPCSENFNIVEHIQATPQAVATSLRDNTNDKVGVQ